MVDTIEGYAECTSCGTQYNIDEDGKLRSCPKCKCDEFAWHTFINQHVRIPLEHISVDIVSGGEK